MTDSNSLDALHSVLFDPIVRDKIERIEQVAGFLLPTEHRTVFENFQQTHVNETYPPHIRKLKLERPKRFQQVLQGISDVAQSLAGVYYHRRNLANTEAMIYAEVDDEKFLSKLKTSTVAIGNTAVLDFEYHALILAARRCLDYLARVIGACFSLDINSFRKINTVRNSLPKQLAVNVVRAHGACMPSLGRLVTDSSEKSIRDVIAHYRFIDAGSLNISKNWSGIFGGPEDLNTKFGRAPR